MVLIRLILFYLIFHLLSFLLMFLIPLLLLSLFLYTSNVDCYLQTYQGMVEAWVAVKKSLEKNAELEGRIIAHGDEL